MLILGTLMFMQGVVGTGTPDGIELDSLDEQRIVEDPVETMEWTLLGEDSTRNIYDQVQYAVGLRSGIYEVTFTLDTANPYVESTTPFDGIKDMRVDATIVVSFSEEMDQGSVRSATELTWTDEHDVSRKVINSFSWSPDGKTMTLSPASNLNGSTEYLLEINVTATDMAGNELYPEIMYSFTTETTRDGDGEDDGMTNLLALIVVIVVAVAAIVVAIPRYMSKAVSSDEVRREDEEL